MLVPGQTFLSNYMGLKIPACSWGKFWIKDTKRLKKNNQLPLLKSREQKQDTEDAPYTHHLRGGQPPKPPLWPEPWTHLYLQPKQGISSKLAPTQGESKQGNLFVLISPATVGAPIKPVLNFLGPQ